MEEVNVVLPAGYGLDGVSTAPVRCYHMVDGVGVLLGLFSSRVRIKPAGEERELMFRSDLKFVDFELQDKRGLEKVDPTPTEIPLRLKASPSMRDQVVEQVSRYLSARAQDQGFESLEEAMDFDLDGELDDLQTRAETQFLAKFAPHEGRAAAGPKVRDPAVNVPSDGPPPVIRDGKTEPKPAPVEPAPRPST